MTTPADWRVIIPQLRDQQSIELTRRLVAYQREWLDSHAAQLEQVQSQLEEQERKIGEGGGQAA
jgi:hypothetical protein